MRRSNMATKIICDICKTNEANRSFRIKQRTKGCYEHFDCCSFWNPSAWTGWEEIDICGKCAEKLLGLEYRGADGRGIPPERR